MGHSVAVVVPWRDKGDEWRKANLTATLAALDGFAPVVVVDDGRTGASPFNRSAAFNRGVAQHPADVYVFHEADMLVPWDQMREGVRAALERPGLVVPFTSYRYLSAEDTPAVRDGADPQGFTPERTMTDGRSIGAVGICSAETMAAVGRWDETFEGWGFDDRAMFRAFQICAGPARWVDGDAWHLYHTPGWSAASRFAGGAEVPERERLATEANESRMRRYKEASTAEQIRELTG